MTIRGGRKRPRGAGIGESPGLRRPRRHRSARTSIIQAQTRVEAAQATERRILADIDDSELKAPRDGRIQYRVAEPGEVLAAGGRVLNMVDLADVYMTFFLPTEQAGLLALGSEARLSLMPRRIW
jgi:HlyD family secretion protein